jgi:peptide/nickel transport system permease protein
MALAAAIPANWPSVWVFLGIMVVLGFIGWTGLARELRGKVLSLRNADFVHAAEVMGAGTPRILFIHLIPNLASHIVVTGTMRIPMMIMAESSLSFLGLGIKAPMTSWGLLLSDANQIQILRLYPWMLIPGVFLVLSVLCFNFAGDALRDVVDPYSS